MLQSTWSLPPQPLLETSQAPLDYPVTALGDLLGPAVERMAEVIGVPQAMAAQSVLATSALATQGHANVHLNGRVYPLSLYLLSIAASGDRKTVVDKLALQPAREWERLQWQAYREKLSRYPATLAQSQKQMATIDCHTDTPIQIEPEPVAPRLISSEPTIEALTKSLCLGLPSMGLFSDEGGQFLGSSTMSRDNRLKAVTTLSSAWDGNPIDHSRSMAGESLRAYDRRLSLLLMLQPYLAGRLLKGPVAQRPRHLRPLPDHLATELGRTALLSAGGSHPRHQSQTLHPTNHRPAATSLGNRQRWRATPRSPTPEEPGPTNLDQPARHHRSPTGRVRRTGQRTTSASKAADNLLRIAGVLAVLEDRDLIEVTHILSAKRSAARRIHTRGRSESGKSKITLQESTMRTL